MKQSFKAALSCVAGVALLSAVNIAYAGNTTTETTPNSTEWNEEEVSFIERMQYEHDIPANEVKDILRRAQYRESVVEAISRPWEARPWFEYYPIFLTDKRLEKGLDFKRRHQETLKRAEAEFGVSPEIITAIIGVETFYGEYMGAHPVLDSLYTLGFHYPPRQNFFRSELAQLILLAREENLSIDELMGSYAGAMGFGQFISSSYRYYAVDFDGDGVRDLLNNKVDAIGSVANYFAKHRWQAGQQVAAPAWVSASTDVEQLTSARGQTLTHTVAELREAGVNFITNLPDDAPARLFAFEEPDNEMSYWVGFQNFYAITRYNHSPLYAMAVFQLAEQLKRHNVPVNNR